MKKSVNATIDTLIRWKSIYSLIGYTEDLEIINSTIDISAIQKRIISKVVVYLISILLLIINYYYIKKLTNLFSTPSEIRTHTGIAAQGIFIPHLLS